MVQFIKNIFQESSKNMRITLYVLVTLVVLFAIFAIQILFWGLGYTDMNNNFTWGAWIIGDLGLVALGGGAFTTGYLLYIFRVDKLRPIINSTVLLGFMCYLFTFVFLLFDLGQPLRCWFGFAYPNWGKGVYPASMLTEVFFCLSIYFCILCVELIPTILEHKVLIKNKVIATIAHYMHVLMWTMAAAGTFLSFFHQGSLGGGMWGVLYGRPVWYSPHFFFMAVVAAIAGGTSFMTMMPYIAGKVMKKEVVPMETYQILTKVSGIVFVGYFIFRVYDVYTAIVKYAPMNFRDYFDMWGGYYGIWMLVLEFILVISAMFFLVQKKYREQEKFMVIGASSGILAIVTSKLSVLLHGFSVPNFPWKGFTAYMPTIQEWAITFGCFACMILIYMIFAKWFPLFPHLEHEEHEAHH
ncbi:MAG TPA: polysulfide reductase NrfD [Spirochaetota bacterium]|nr:polysulfide reductase NrfD [Spirochaetota bacterium]HOK93319.1 polysulfide reductase NrfD [Spirochaetota bacterium]HPP95603.1 polysulfide reductase NrfD [Spirochaetota bacterium]